MKLAHKFCAWICAALLLVPLAACSEGNQKSVQAGTLSGDQSTGTQIVGKVTSVVGNQVTLAVGTLNETKNQSSGTGKGRSGKTSSGESPAASQAASSVDSSSTASEESGRSSSSGLITLTGETKTLLIPVGLSLSVDQSGGASGGSSGSGTGSARGNAAMGGNQGGAPSGGGTGGASGGSNQKSGSAGTAQTTQKSRDFSSITKGMILQITEKTLSDGTQGIVKVAVLSE